MQCDNKSERVPHASVYYKTLSKAHAHNHIRTFIHTTHYNTRNIRMRNDIIKENNAYQT